MKLLDELLSESRKADCACDMQDAAYHRQKANHIKKQIEAHLDALSSIKERLKYT